MEPERGGTPRKERRRAARDAMGGAALAAGLSILAFLNLAIGDSTKWSVLAGISGLLLAAPLLAAALAQKGFRSAVFASGLAGSAAYAALLLAAVEVEVRPRGDPAAFWVAWAASAVLGAGVARAVATRLLRER